MDLIKLTLSASLIEGAVLVSVRRPDPLRVLARALVGLAGGLWVGLAVTGFGRDHDGLLGQVHSILGGVIVTDTLFAAAMSLAAFVQRWRRQPVRTIGRIVLAGFSLLLCLSTSFTGYLRPSDPAAQPETNLRFQVLHMGLQPLVLSALLVAWWFTLRPAAAIPSD